MRVFTIWPADKAGNPAGSPSAWRQTKRWLVLDITDGLDDARLVVGPVSREVALKTELDVRVAQRKP